MRSRGTVELNAARLLLRNGVDFYNLTYSDRHASGANLTLGT